MPLDKSIRYALERDPYAYPVHQPEIDPPAAKNYNALLTVSQETYTDPSLQEQ